MRRRGVIGGDRCLVCQGGDIATAIVVTVVTLLELRGVGGLNHVRSRGKIEEPGCTRALCFKARL